MMARREGKKLGMPYLRRLIRQEKVGRPTHQPLLLLSLVAPPLCRSDALTTVANVAIGFTLFQTYTLTEALLLHGCAHTSPFSPLWVVAVAGATAGAAQCIISAPLENMRLVLQRLLVRDISSTSTVPGILRHPLATWNTVVRAALLPFVPRYWYHRLMRRLKGPPAALEPKKPTVYRPTSSHVRLLSRRVHGVSLVLSLVRDSAGFASFFVSFECARRAAFHTSLAVDKFVQMVRHKGPAALALPNDTEKGQNMDISFNTSRTVYGRGVAAFLLVCGGAFGALLYELVSRPIEFVRMVTWYGLHQPARHRTRAAAAMKLRGHGKVPLHRQASSAHTVHQARHPHTTCRLRTVRHRVVPSRQRAPSIWQKLLLYARRTAPPGTHARPLSLLFQTFLVRPFLRPELCKASAPRPWGAAPAAPPPPSVPVWRAFRPERGTIGSWVTRAAQRHSARAGAVAAPFGYMLNRVRSAPNPAYFAVWMCVLGLCVDGWRPRLAG